MTDAAKPAPSWPARPALVARVALVTALGLASMVWVKLSLAALALGLIVFLSLPEAKGASATATSRRAFNWALLAGAVGATLGAVRFVIAEAVPGMVQGGRAAIAQDAVARLREVVFAEDTLRKQGYVDPDGDGIGSAALISELTGALPLRGG